jgi:hypothetical protein
LPALGAIAYPAAALKPDHHRKRDSRAPHGL